jgi:hypothetical protein
VHSKMDFSLWFWEQKQPVFLQCTQCNDPRDTAHTWWGGRRRLSWCRKSLGGRCHGKKCLVYSIFYVFHTGTSLGKTSCWRELPWKYCVREAGCPVFEPSNMIQVLRSLKPHATFRGNGQKVAWSGCHQTWFDFWGAWNLKYNFSCPFYRSPTVEHIFCSMVGETCSRKWPICVMMEKINEIWHWAPSNTYHMIASKQLSNITIHQ